MLARTARILGATAVAAMGLTAGLGATASANEATGTVDADGGLNSRIAPSPHTQKTYTFKDGAKLALNCMTKGSSVEGDNEWYLVNAEGEAHWVSAHYVDVNGEEPTFCGADPSKSVKLDQDTKSYQGPSTKDKKLRSFSAGGSQEVTCFVYTESGATKRWVATLEDGWIPASAFTNLEGVPYCGRM